MPYWLIDHAERPDISADGGMLQLYNFIARIAGGVGNWDYRFCWVGCDIELTLFSMPGI